LTPFSAQIRKEVLAAFPQWELLAEEDTCKGSAPYLVVTVPAPPQANTDLPLRISTWDEEVTVDFDYYHTHFDRWNPEKDDDLHQSALLFVQAILQEKVAAASWWQGDQCKVSSQVEPGAPLDPPFKVAYSKVRVRSWFGTHNAGDA
jgi:hypothetical protein